MQQNEQTDTVRNRKKKIAFTVVLVMLLTPAIGTAILFAIVSRQSNHVNSLCKSNMEILGKAFQDYAGHHDGKLPSAANWAKAIEPYINDSDVFRCPNDLTQGFTSYAMNESLSDKKISSLKNKSQLVLLYEVDKSGDSPQGDGKNIYHVGHENGGQGRHGGNFYRFNFYLFADGHVSYPKAFNDTYSYYWQNGVKPKPAPPAPPNKNTGLLF